MRITTISEARELVGRTFERDGEQRSITFMRFFPVPTGKLTPGIVICERPGAPSNHFDSYLWRKFSDWLEGATEVTDG